MSKTPDTPINTQVKICALWIAITLSLIYAELFRLYVPGGLERKVITLGAMQEFGTGALLFAAVPIVMIFLSIALNAVFSRILNIIVGTLSLLMWASLWIVESRIAALLGMRSTVVARQVAVSLEAIATVFIALVVWYAVKWHRTADAM